MADVLDIVGKMRPITTYSMSATGLAAMGAIPYMDTILKFGRNTAITAGVAEDVWDGGGIWAQPTIARIHNIASVGLNAAEDDVGGDGAITVEIFGLDANYLEQNEIITMNGVANVPTVNAYIMIHRMVVRSAGVTGSNEGIITATAVTDATVTAQIEIGNNQTLMAIYQVPAGKTALMCSYFFSMNDAVRTGGLDVSLLIKPFGEVFQHKHHMGAISTGTSHVHHPFNIPLKITEKSVIKMEAHVSINDTDVSAGFDLLLIDN